MDLLPCPFCGSKNFFKSTRVEKVPVFRVGCNTCYASIERLGKEEAVKVWNLRAPENKESK